MSSGNEYERYVKLTSSLTQLVVADKRNLAGINNVIHGLVFDKPKKVPTAKNWSIIVTLWKNPWWRSDRNFVLALATLNMELVARRDPHALALVEAYPECFGDKEVRCPVPISLILTLAAQGGVAKGSSMDHDWAEKAKQAVECCRGFDTDHDGRNGLLERLGIPYVTLRTGEAEWPHEDLPFVPDITFDPMKRVGDILQYGEKWYVVLENNKQACLLYIASREFVDDERPNIP